MTLTERAAQGCPMCKGTGVIHVWDHRQTMPCPTCVRAIAVAEAHGEQRYQEGQDAARERVADTMTQLGFATGHGDAVDDLLTELRWQVEELRQRETETP